MENNRIFYLDFIRVIALFCIIWCHTNIIEYDSYLLEKVKWFLGKCGVPLFFTISGYLAFPMNKPIKQFCIQKVKRVFIPFISWLLIYTIWAYFYGVPIVLRGDILNEGSAHLWFIYVIIGLYIIVPILDPFLRQVSRTVLRTYLIIWGITSLFPLILYRLDISYNEHNFMYSLCYLYGYIGYFLLGTYFRKYGDQTRLLKFSTSCLFFIITILIIGAYFFLFNCQTVVVSDSKGLPMILYSIAMFAIMKRIAPYLYKSKLKNGIIVLSINSFGIYLCHMLVVFHVYPLIPIIEWLPDLLATCLLVIINIAVSFFIVKILSKIRYSHYLLG